MADTATPAITLDFIEEEIPRIVRTGGTGRAPERWEDHLAPLKAHVGKSFRVWTYEKRTGALSRVSSVRSRLIDATPEDNWTIAVREVPNTEGQFGVYVQFNGVFTPEEVAENAKARQERSDRIKAQRAAAEAAEGKVAAAEATPAERVAAAKSKQAAK